MSNRDKMAIWHGKFRLVSSFLMTRQAISRRVLTPIPYFQQETYGHYAELVHKIDQLSQAGVTLAEDLTSQRDFMDFVCRSFATRLERRRNILITSARFFRLVSEVDSADLEKTTYNTKYLHGFNSKNDWNSFKCHSLRP